ncbi:hypothetical protein D043_2707B, partial [Vibrio parahaemolyticus EKP-021]
RLVQLQCSPFLFTPTDLAKI